MAVLAFAVLTLLLLLFKGVLKFISLHFKVAGVIVSTLEVNAM